MIPSSSGLETLVVAVMILSLGAALWAIPATACFWRAYRKRGKPLRVFFSDVAVKLVGGGNTWVKAR